MMKTAKKITLCGILTALSILSFMLENLFPPMFVPGARIGISNLFILLTLVLLGAPWAFAALIIKCILCSLFSGNIFAVVYSLPAGVIALTVEILLLVFTKNVSVVAISVAGAVINAIIQNAIYCLITESLYFLSYMPFLVAVSVVGGLTVGFAVYLIVKALPKGYLGG